MGAFASLLPTGKVARKDAAIRVGGFGFFEIRLIHVVERVRRGEAKRHHELGAGIVGRRLGEFAEGIHRGVSSAEGKAKPGVVQCSLRS